MNTHVCLWRSIRPFYPIWHEHPRLSLNKHRAVLSYLTWTPTSVFEQASGRFILSDMNTHVCLWKSMAKDKQKFATLKYWNTHYYNNYISYTKRHTPSRHFAFLSHQVHTYIHKVRNEVLSKLYASTRPSVTTDYSSAYSLLSVLCQKKTLEKPFNTELKVSFAWRFDPLVHCPLDVIIIMTSSPKVFPIC